MHPIPKLVLAAMLCTSVVACSKKVKDCLLYTSRCV